MSRKADCRHSSRRDRHLHLDLQDVAAMRQNEGDPNAFERILAACKRWISDHVSRTLSHADREEMIDSAILSVIPELQSDRVLPETFRLHLEEQLEAQRAKRQQHISRFVRLIEREHSSLPSPHSPDDNLHLEFWVDVVGEIEQYMFPAFLSLSEQDQDLLIQSYDLEEMADSSRPHKPRYFVSMGARRAALYRARNRFSKHLDAMLVAALEIEKLERTPLEAALRIVRGKALAKAVKAVKGLKRER